MGPNLSRRDNMKQEIMAFLQKEIDSLHIPGAVIQVSHHDQTVLQEAIGYREIFPERKPMALDTVFDLASLTKVIATLPAILKLIEYGEIRLDDPVANFFPSFKVKGKEDVTIRHLLTHTSGLRAHRNYFLELNSTEEVLESIFQEELLHPPGKKVIYSDLGFILLYRIIEQAAKEEFPGFIDRELFMPLGMKDTGFVPSFERDRYAATEYSESLKDYKHGIVHDDNTEMMGGISGHAGLFSTLKDVSHFAEMVENEGSFKGKQILSPASFRLSRQNYTQHDDEYRGLGWILKGPGASTCGDLFSPLSYGHTGFTGTSLWFDPAAGLRVILLTNRVHFGRNDPIIRLRPRLHNIIRKHFY
jgi:CubicO group peptidase (beta-lactamase class C family)